MSTRCHIAICKNENDQEDGVFKRLYHHCDGYPSGVGSELIKILRGCPRPWTPESVQEYIANYDDEYRIIDSDVAWDQEYVYIIDCEKEELKGYHKGFDKSFDIRWPGDEIVIPDNPFSKYPTTQPKTAIALTTITRQLSNDRCEEFIETLELDERSTVANIREWANKLKTQQMPGTCMGNIVIKFK